MRAPPGAVAQYLTHLAGQPSSPPTLTDCEPSPHPCRWRPYSVSNDFEANAAMILIVLFCALICALALNAAIRCFLRGGDRLPDRLPRTQRDQQQQQRKPAPDAGAAPMVMAPTVAFSPGLKLAGAEAECAICLSEFVEGEGIQVLGRCNHGFHVQCIEKWFYSHTSCPTCRCSCLPPEQEADASAAAAANLNPPLPEAETGQQPQQQLQHS